MDDYDFEEWHKDVQVDEEELKRKLKKKRKAEQKKAREEAKKKKEEEEKKKKQDNSDEEDDNSDDEDSKKDKKKEKKDKKKEKKEKRKEKKEKKKEKKRKHEEVDDGDNDTDDEESNDDGDKTERKNKKKKKENGTNSIKKGEFGIWVGNLSFSTTEQMLRDFFNDCGTITRVNLPINKQTKRNKGFAYVDFETAESMNNAIALSEQELEGRNLLIKSSSDFRGRPSKNQITENDTNTTTNNFNSNNRNNNRFNNNVFNNKKNGKKESPTLFIGNLPFAATSEGIAKCFQDFGEISNIRIATFEDNPEKCKGFAYIDYASVDSAIKAVNSGKKPRLLGRFLRVEFAGEDATRRGYNLLHKKTRNYGNNNNNNNNNSDNSNSQDDNNTEEKITKEPRPVNIAKWDGELVSFQGKKTVFDDDE